MKEFVVLEAEHRRLQLAGWSVEEGGLELLVLDLRLVERRDLVDVPRRG